MLHYLFGGLSPSYYESTCSDKEIVSKTVQVDELKLHYLVAGQGPTVILLHGYAQTSRMSVIPLLAGKLA